MDESAIKNFVKTILLPFKMAWQTIINPAHVGGNIKTDDVGSGTAGSEENYALMAFAIRPPVASDPVIMLPHGTGKVAAGTPQSPHFGKPLHDSYWMVPVESPSVETTLAVASRARRFTAPKSMPVSVASVNVTTSQSGSTATVKIYADDGTTTPVLIWQSGGIATTGTQVKKSTPNTPVWIYMGWDYIIEYSNTDATVAVTAHQLSTNADNLLNDGAAQIATTAANLVANTGINNVEFPLIKLT